MPAGLAQRILPDTDAALAGLLFAVDPHGLGGVCLRGRPGHYRDAWLDSVRALLRPQSPWLKVPVNVSDDRLVGGLDFAATMQAGKPVFSTGMLEAADGGVTLLAMAERLQTSVAAVISQVLDTGTLHVERDGLTRLKDSRFGVIAVDEGLEEDERIPDPLADRLAFKVNLATQSVARSDFGDWTANDVEQARTRLAHIPCEPEAVELLCSAAMTFAAPSLRTELFALRAARAAASLTGRETVTAELAGIGLRLVVPHRARRLPESREAQQTESPPEEPEQSDPSSAGSQVPDEVLVDAVTAAIPPGLLALLQAASKPKRRQAAGGKGEAQTRSRRRGRPIGVQPAEPGSGKRLNVLATLKSAAPWQKLRRAAQSGRQPGKQALLIRKEDLQVSRFRDRVETTIVFAVDASGSQAAQRLAEVKGAVELLLLDCYVRRDQVALIAFRGHEAEVLLAPTRSLARAKRALTALPGGGGTPLASGIDRAREMAEKIAREGRVPAIILLTDGRANIARDASAGAGKAEEEALASARLFAHAGYQSMLVDTARRPRPRASALANMMGAQYVPLPHADARSLSATIRQGVAR